MELNTCPGSDKQAMKMENVLALALAKSPNASAKLFVNVTTWTFLMGPTCCMCNPPPPPHHLHLLQIDVLCPVVAAARTVGV